MKGTFKLFKFGVIKKNINLSLEYYIVLQQSEELVKTTENVYDVTDTFSLFLNFISYISTKSGMLTCVYILRTMLFIVFFPLREGVSDFWIFDGET